MNFKSQVKFRQTNKKLDINHISSIKNKGLIGFDLEILDISYTNISKILCQTKELNCYGNRSFM